MLATRLPGSASRRKPLRCSARTHLCRRGCRSWQSVVASTTP
jgi:hypothetical protein